MTREEIVTGLKAGRTLVIDRRDSPVLPIVEELVEYEPCENCGVLLPLDALDGCGLCLVCAALSGEVRDDG